MQIIFMLRTVPLRMEYRPPCVNYAKVAPRARIRRHSSGKTVSCPAQTVSLDQSHLIRNTYFLKKGIFDSGAITSRLAAIGITTKAAHVSGRLHVW